MFTVTFSSPARGVIGSGSPIIWWCCPARPSYQLNSDDDHPVKVDVGAAEARLTSGELSVVVQLDGPWDVRFEQDGRPLTNSQGSQHRPDHRPEGKQYLHEQLALGVGETVYGLGERFGPLVKNGQISTSGTPTAARPASRPTRTSRST